MNILGELPWAIVALETDCQAYCVKCKQKTGVKNEKYKPMKPNQLIEKAQCKDCGSTVRSFRKASFYHKRDSNQYKPLEFVNLDTLLGKEMGRRIRKKQKYHPLKSQTVAVNSLELDPRVIERSVNDARRREMSTRLATKNQSRMQQRQRMRHQSSRARIFGGLAPTGNQMQQQFMQQQITQQQMQNQMVARRYRQGRQPGMMQQAAQMQALRSAATGGLWGLGQGLVPQDEGGEE